MAIIKHLNARNIVFFFLLFFALLNTGCEGTEVVLELLSLDSDASDNDHWNDNGTDDTSSSQFGEDDVTDCGDVVWEDSVWIDYDLEMKMLEGVGVTHIKGSLLIRKLSKAGLEYMEVFKDLRCVDHSVTIADIDSLSDLDVFSNLHTIGDDIFIQNNRTLADLSGLHHLQSFSGNVLYINDNDSLPTCEARDLYNTVSEDLGWGGTACIVDNAYDECDNLSRGCNDAYLRY